MNKKNRNQSGHPSNLHHMNIDAQLRHARGESNRVRNAVKPNPQSSQEFERGPFEKEFYALINGDRETPGLDLAYHFVAVALGDDGAVNVPIRTQIRLRDMLSAHGNTLIAQHDATIKAKVLAKIGTAEIVPTDELKGLDSDAKLVLLATASGRNQLRAELRQAVINIFESEEVA